MTSMTGSSQTFVEMVLHVIYGRRSGAKSISPPSDGASSSTIVPQLGPRLPKGRLHRSICGQAHTTPPTSTSLFENTVCARIGYFPLTQTWVSYRLFFQPQSPPSPSPSPIWEVRRDSRYQILQIFCITRAVEVDFGATEAAL